MKQYLTVAIHLVLFGKLRPPLMPDATPPVNRFRQLLLPRLGTTLEDAVGGDAKGILDREELAELVEQGQSKTGIAAQFDLYAGEGRLQR